MADTNVILKYRRPQDSWICPECDAENTLVHARCSVCGCGKFGTTAIVKAWSEADERPPASSHSAIRGPYSTSYPTGGTTPYTYTTSYGTGRRPGYSRSKAHSHTALIWTIVIVAIILLIIWMANNA